MTTSVRNIAIGESTVKLPRPSFNHLIFLALALIFMYFTSCSPSIDEPKKIETHNLYRLDDRSLNNHPEWKETINKVRGSVGKRGSGSKTVWSRKNAFGLGVYLSANHVYNISGWKSRNPEVVDLLKENPGIFEGSQLPPASGSLDLGSQLVSDFPLLHFAISANATNITLLPEEDFFIGVIDGQTAIQSAFPQYPEKLKTDSPLGMYDPDNRTKSTKTWDKPLSGEIVFGIGYPLDRPNFPFGAVAIGKVLSDAEALETITKLKSSGDSEGEIPFKPDVEFFMDAQGLAGMSGGGVFNKEGKLLGIIVRASDQNEAPKIIRVVKVDYIQKKLKSLIPTLSTEEKTLIDSILSGEISNG